ncbi:MAG: FtsW/RodA/SpoVE family cell cycle protein [Clostridia bacterium]|nr:FtsW/RodA/SpoVE family cell cycle protein [Clostridia bacterium]
MLDQCNNRSYLVRYRGLWLPLPFISAGSTSLVVFMSAIGVVLNINKQSKSRV